MSKRSRSRQRDAFQRRYRGNWNGIATRTRRLTRDRCILNPIHKAEAVHHLRYRDGGGKIAGREKPGWDVVPVCRRCHGRLHRQQFWYSAKRNPALNNRQRWLVLWRLRLRFWFWATLLNGWWFPVLLATAAVVWLLAG